MVALAAMLGRGDSRSFSTRALSRTGVHGSEISQAPQPLHALLLAAVPPGALAGTGQARTGHTAQRTVSLVVEAAPGQFLAHVEGPHIQTILQTAVGL